VERSDVLCLTAMHKDPSAVSVGGSLHSRRKSLPNDEPLEARPDSWPYTLGKFFRRNWQSLSVTGAMIALMIVVVPWPCAYPGRGRPVKPRVRTLAVLPFETPPTIPA